MKHVKSSMADARGRVLVIGAGHLNYSSFISHHEAEIHQLDLKAYGSHVTTIANAESLPFASRTFDAVFAFSIRAH